MDVHTLPKDGGRGLERDMVVTAALQLLDEVGFSGLTLRRLADRLKVKAAALYWHFENKQDLIDALAERIMMAEFDRIRPKSLDWRDMLAMIGRTHRRALMRYRDGAEVMAHANLRHNTMLEGMELLLQTLQAQGFTPEQAMASVFTVIRFTIGCVFEEQADPRSKETSHQERVHRIQELSERYPTFAGSIKAVMADAGKGPDYLFERGLQFILDGVAAGLAQPGSEHA
ncbi:MAG TPA: TetR/AcrR family transcriptional regulator C-terminal domain-containing protein [Candidatus Saccharimonadales bacterium]